MTLLQKKAEYMRLWRARNHAKWQAYIRPYRKAYYERNGDAIRAAERQRYWAKKKPISRLTAEETEI